MMGNDVGMDMTVGSWIGLIVAGLIALLFLVSCVLSVVKAVRDRRDIKARIAAKRASRLNGHAPGATNASLDDGRRGRPNILIIHDDAREERMKKNTILTTSMSSPRLPSGISSPEELNSRHTESTTVAEVACHHNSLTTTPGDDDSDGAEAGVSGVYNGRCVLPEQVSDGVDNDSKVQTPVDVNGEAITYTRKSVSNCDPSSSITTFLEHCSVDKERDGSTKPATRAGMSDTSPGGSKGKDFTRKNTLQSSLNYVAHDDNISDAEKTEEAVNSPGKGLTTSHGFSKNKVSPHHTAHATLYVCAKYNPRRNSYAAAIASDPDLVDRVTVRRHSDEARHPVASTSHHRKDNLRMRSHCRDGEDNPAFNAPDDKAVAL